MDISEKSARNQVPNGRFLEVKGHARSWLSAGTCAFFLIQLSAPAFSVSLDPACNAAKSFVVSTFNTKVETTLTDDDTVNPKNGSLPTNHLAGTVSSNKQIVVASKQHVNLGKYHGFLVNVQNDTDETWICDGDKAVAILGSANLQAASVEDVARVAMPNRTLGGDIAQTAASAVIAAVTIGGASAIRDIKSQSGPVTHRYGADEARRLDEQSRFGRRVLLPGESTTGLLYFKMAKGSGSVGKVMGNESASISIPISLMYDAEDSNAITGLR